MTISIDSTLLLNYYYAKAGIPLSETSSGGTTTTTAAGSTPSAPWSVTQTAQQASQQSNSLVSQLLGGQNVFNPSTVKLGATNSSASPNYKNLFTLYQGLTALEDLTNQAGTTGVTQSQLTQYQTAFASGLQNLQTYLGDQPFRGFQVETGGVAASQQSASVTAPSYTYTTGVLASSNNTPIQALSGNVQFAMTITLPSGSNKVVDFNLGDMTQPRTLSNVVSYLNSQLKAAGVSTTFSDVMTPGQPQTVTVGNQTYTIPAGPDQYSLQINGNSVEQVSLSPLTTASPGVYVTQSQGSAYVAASDVSQQLLGLNTTSSGTTAKTFSDTLGNEVQNTIATATTASGSVYVLADINGATQAGETDTSQKIVGSQDVALMEYDSTGNLMFTRTLGSTLSASGLGLAVSAAGNEVAVVGSGSGLIASNGSGNATTTSSGFLSVYDGDGQIQWTQTLQNGQAGQADQVAFGSSGSVYVAGTTQLGGSGLSENYLAGYTNTGVQIFSAATGIASQSSVSGLVVDGSSVITAGTQNGDAVVRSYSVGNGTASLAATQDLGALDGGNVVGVALGASGTIEVAGSTHNGALNAGDITNAYSGGEEAFVAQLNGNLTPSTADTLTYYSTGGDTRATAMTVAGGQVYLAGQASTGSGDDGFAVQIDPNSGAVGWSDEYSGTDNTVDPTSISVDPTGYSSLNALGLPTGTINFAPSQTIAANTPLQPGEQFEIQTSAQGIPSTITVDAGDTLQTLAQKIIQASGFEANATVATVNGVQELNITPGFPGVQITIMAGPSGANALPALGLTEGVITSTATAKAKSTNPAVAATNSLKANYALGLSSTLNITTAAGLKNAQVQLGAAITQVKQIYTDMTTPPSTSKGNSGSVPAYLTAEISSYQSALYRLQAANGTTA